ncbi:MAG TPA: amidase, partial [Candidatus Sulfotelmatobacter sp.]|nr:amidase [Candidatus Sulfotelmatobacter sp.]
MAKSRRDFLTITSLGVLGTAAASRLLAQNPSNLPAGAPPAFGAGPAFGPEVSTGTFGEAEKLVQFPLTEVERAMAAASWRKTLASVYERRTGPRKLELEDTLAPATTWNAAIPGTNAAEQRDR